jgi:hypothetical protein
MNGRDREKHHQEGEVRDDPASAQAAIGGDDGVRLRRLHWDLVQGAYCYTHHKRPILPGCCWRFRRRWRLFSARSAVSIRCDGLAAAATQALGAAVKVGNVGEPCEAPPARQDQEREAPTRREE